MPLQYEAGDIYDAIQEYCSYHLVFSIANLPRNHLTKKRQNCHRPEGNKSLYVEHLI